MQVLRPAKKIWQGLGCLVSEFKPRSKCQNFKTAWTDPHAKPIRVKHSVALLVELLRTLEKLSAAYSGQHVKSEGRPKNPALADCGSHLHGSVGQLANNISIGKLPGFSPHGSPRCSSCLGGSLIHLCSFKMLTANLGNKKLAC